MQRLVLAPLSLVKLNCKLVRPVQLALPLPMWPLHAMFGAMSLCRGGSCGCRLPETGSYCLVLTPLLALVPLLKPLHDLLSPCNSVTVGSNVKLTEV